MKIFYAPWLLRIVAIIWLLSVISLPSLLQSVNIEQRREKLFGNSGYCCYVLKQIDNKILGTTTRQTPQAASIALATLRTVQPATLKVLWAVDPAISLSIYYVDISVTLHMSCNHTNSNRLGNRSVSI